MNLYMMNAVIAGDLVSASHVAAKTPAEARAWYDANFFKPVPAVVIEKAPAMAAHISECQRRARSIGVTITARKSSAAMSQAINL